MEFLTVKETAAIFRLSPRRIQELAAAGLLKARKPFGGMVLIEKKSVADKLGVRVDEL
ncbi:MAG: helix-turn-helix domain-containing protein [Elusimicrobia bacterium]|nr:helix-turn-helix domain-containing protein [Elusimicrobiota bacterium]